MMAEVHDETGANSNAHELILNLGARWDLSERYTVLISVGRDLSDTLYATSTVLAYLGLQTHI